MMTTTLIESVRRVVNVLIEGNCSCSKGEERGALSPPSPGRSSSAISALILRRRPPKPSAAELSLETPHDDDVTL